MAHLINVSEAKKIVFEHTGSLPGVRMPLFQAAGLTLAENIYASIDIPSFPQSSMDGYAFSFTGWRQQKKLKIEGEVVAGSNEPLVLGAGKAARIFTGAAVPQGADTVVMQEKIKVISGALFIEDEKLEMGANVRLKGSEIKAGAMALEVNSSLTPAAVGFLAGIGVVDVVVYPNPSICIIITGNELQQPGTPLAHGRVYESNSFALKAVLKQLNINNVEVLFANDKLETITVALETALRQFDVVLLTGGISVGDYDFVLRAATACGVGMLFHKVRQRPGKPLYFGKQNNKIVFGLPGNPSSVLTCFYQYVVPALEKLSNKRPFLQKIIAPLLNPIQKTASLTYFLKGIYDGEAIAPLDAQESYRLSSFARANCLIQIDEEVTTCSEGELVTGYLLPD